MELQVLGRLYSDLMRHVNKVYRLRIAYNMFEDMIIKYAWSAAGLLIASLPVFFPAIAGVSIGDGETEREKTGDRTASFVTNKR